MSDKKITVLVIHEKDNVGIALSKNLSKDELVVAGDYSFVALDPIPTGHKLALSDIAEGGWVIKYGEIIGKAKTAIKKGEHVHVHNVEDITESLAQESKRS